MQNMLIEVERGRARQKISKVSTSIHEITKIINDLLIAKLKLMIFMQS